MLEITVKTIDGQNRSYSIPETYTVKQFKEKITGSLNIPVERQRLIFQGRELKDDKNLSEFDVNGKTIHLVQRTPPQFVTTPSATTTTSSSAPTSTGQRHGPITTETNIFIGSGSGNDMQSILQLINGLGGLEQPINTTSSTTNGNGNIQNELENMSNSMNEQEIRSRIRSIRRLLTLAQSRLNRLQEIQSGAPLNDISAQMLIQTTRNISIIQDEGISSIYSITSEPETIISAQITNQYPTTTPTEPSQQPTEPQPTPSAPETPQESPNIRVEVLADVIQSVMDTYTRFLPYLTQYHQLLIEDSPEPNESESGENRRQRFCNNINDMMHLMGHLMHNLSDLHVNVREAPPRQMRTMIPMQTAVLSAIPIAEASFQIPIAEASFQIPIAISAQLSSSNENSNHSIASSTDEDDSNPAAPTNTATGTGTTATPTRPSPFSFISSLITSAGRAVPTRPMPPNGTSTIPTPTPNQSSQMDPYLRCSSVHLMTSNIMAATSMEPRIRLGSQSSQRRRHPAGNQPNAPAPSQTSPDGTQAPPQQQPFNQLNRVITDLLTSIMRPPGATATATPAATSAAPRPSAPPYSEIVRDMMDLIATSQHSVDVSHLRHMAAPIGEIMGTQIDRVMPPMNALLFLVNYALESMNFRSLSALIERSASADNVFEGMQRGLRVQIREHFLTEGSILDEQALVSRLYEELGVDFGRFEIDGTPGYDVEESFRRMIKHHLRSILEHVYFETEASGDAQWSKELHRLLVNLRDHVFTFFRLFVKNGDEVLVAWLKVRLSKVKPDQKYATLNVVFELIKKHFVEKLSTESFRLRAIGEIERFFVAKTWHVESESETRRAPSNASGSSTIEEEEMVVDDVAWDGGLLQEWAPIIREDVKKQRSEEKQQRPFSDAYITGMPAKRRKLYPKVEMSSSNLLRGVMQRTVEKMAPTKKSELSDAQLVDKFETDAQASRAFDQVLDSEIADRLKGDADCMEAREDNQSNQRFIYSQKRV